MSAFGNKEWEARLQRVVSRSIEKGYAAEDRERAAFLAGVRAVCDQIDNVEVPGGGNDFECMPIGTARRLRELETFVDTVQPARES